MGINEIIPRKEITEKKRKEKEYKLKIKKLRNKVIRNPSKMFDFYEESIKLMEEAVKDGLMTEKEKRQHEEKFNRDVNQLQNIKNKFIEKFKRKK